MAKKYVIANKTEAKRFRKLYDSANAAYHNGQAIMLDADHDALTKALLPYYPDVVSTIGAAVPKNASARKVALPNPMNSLDKVRGDDKDFATQIKRVKSTKVIAEIKVDGVSLQAVKHKGVVRLFTRGDGRVGQDVSHLVPLLNMGKLEEGMEMRFELVLTHKAYAKVKKDDKPARGYISGLVNSSKNISESVAKAATCIAFTIYKPQMSPLAQLKKLAQLGWKIPKYKLISDLSPENLTKVLAALKTTATHEADGLVLLKNVYEKPAIGSNPRNSIAFKVDEAPVVVTVTKVVWTPSQYGLLKPVAHFKPTIIGGVSVAKATAHNAMQVMQGKIGPGAKIGVIRAGDVIPKIVKVVKGAAKPSMPPASSFEWNGADIQSVSDEHDDAIAMAQVSAFFSAIGVLGFGDVIAGKVAHMSIADICRLTPEGWRKLGVGQADSNKLPAAIKTALKTTTVPRLMAASSAFGRLFGLTKASALWAAFGHKPPNSKKQFAADIAALPGFSATTANKVATNWKAWVQFYNALPYKPATIKKAIDLTGHSYVFSEFRDKELENFIIANGGKVSSSVSSKTTALFTYKTSMSIKAKAAKALKVTIVEPDNARKAVGMP